ncbi:MAG: hypothetical protein WBN40_00390 [Pseudomonadales bacterium]
MLLTLLSLALRGMMPAGFMPASIGENAPLKLCSGKFSHHALNTLLPAVEGREKASEPLQKETHADPRHCEITGYSFSDTIRTGAPFLLDPERNATQQMPAVLISPFAAYPAINRARAPPKHFETV